MRRVLLGIGAALLLAVTLTAPVYFRVTQVMPNATPTATILFGGDLMFDRYIRQITDTVGGDYIFSCIDAALASPDLVVANLEGPITDNEPIGGMTFTFPRSTAVLLVRHHIRMVNIGNNHSTNFGAEGVVATKKYLSDAGVAYFGDDVVATTTINGVKLAFVNYNQFSSVTVPPFPPGYHTIVYTHWGEEYQPATDKEKATAHALIDAGAEMVVGSHPHIVQEHEMYHGKHIYYSLGNLIFDQYFSDAVTHGLLISVTISESGVQSVKEIPVVLSRDGRTCVGR